MILTDTHIHLYSEDFNEDREKVISEAMTKGVKRFFLPAIDSTYVNSMYELKEKYPENVFLMAGLHPTHVKENFEEELAFVEEQLGERNFRAIGEIGIDLYWDKTTLEIQQKAFRRQIRLAKKHRLPIVIHCREAFDEVFEVLESEKGDDLFGIFHCFTGNLEQAKKALSYNMKLGIGG
ncbi:MAG: TatD family hydrolase, partial [Salegentibacter sp.]